MSILAVNVGSSSLKFALFPVRDDAIAPALVTGNIEGLEPSGQPRITLRELDGDKETLPVQHHDEHDVFAAALQALHDLIRERFAHVQVQAIAHRIVHGGPLYKHSIAVTPQVMQALARFNPLAPLHQPHNLAGVQAFANSFEGVLQVACFDTAFHAHLPELETTFAIDRSLTESGVRRYGFHGLSYQYVSEALQAVSPRSNERLIMAHLGNGASVCAAKGHQSRATSMGFSALDGLMMGTRCGALDPGVLLYLMEQGWDHARIEKMLYKQSGLLGVSGVSADMRTLRASDSASARFATDLFAHRVAKEIAAQTASIGGLDVLAFTGGIGEHDVLLREQVCRDLAYLGLEIDPRANQNVTPGVSCAIQTANSAIEIWVVPTDEEQVAARDALQILRTGACVTIAPTAH